MQHRAAALLLCLVAAGTAPARAARPAASAALTAGAAAGLPVGAPAPWFCHNLDCPKFTVVSRAGCKLRSAAHAVQAGKGSSLDPIPCRTRTSHPPPPPTSPPPPCQVNTTDDYEVRYYEAGAWVSTDVEAYAYALGVSKGFQVGHACAWWAGWGG